MDSVVKEATKEIRKRIEQHENQRLEERLKAIPNSHDAFKTVNKLAGKKPKRAEDCNFSVNGKPIESTEGKAELMCAFYEDLYKETTPTNELMPLIEEANKEVEEWQSGMTFTEERSAMNQTNEEWQVSSNELNVIRLKLNNKKSCGSDGLSNYILKRCPIMGHYANHSEQLHRKQLLPEGVEESDYSTNTKDDGSCNTQRFQAN